MVKEAILLEECVLNGDYFKLRLIKSGRGCTLNSLISKTEVSDEELGLVYATLALSQPKANRVSSFDYVDGKTQAKLRFQESTRVGLYLMVNRLLNGRDFESLKDSYTSRLEQINSEGRRFHSGIEGEVYIITQGKENFGVIGEALKEGAQDYAKFLEDRRSWLEYKAVEYNKIHEALKKR
jgi:hypothetical protein